MTETTVTKGAVIQEVTDPEFQAQVLEHPGPVLVDIWAPWCGPCRMLAPVLEDLASELAGRVKVCKLNADENPETTQRFGVQAIPTVLMFRGGEIVESFVGVQSKERYRRAVESHLD